MPLIYIVMRCSLGLQILRVPDRLCNSGISVVVRRKLLMFQNETLLQENQVGEKDTSKNGRKPTKSQQKVLKISKRFKKYLVKGYGPWYHCDNSGTTARTGLNLVLLDTPAWLMLKSLNS